MSVLGGFCSCAGRFVFLVRYWLNKVLTSSTRHCCVYCISPIVSEDLWARIICYNNRKEQKGVFHVKTAIYRDFEKAHL